jgi:hypothetical protein
MILPLEFQNICRLPLILDTVNLIWILGLKEINKFIWLVKRTH